jgi:hypothetical protein
MASRGQVGDPTEADMRLERISTLAAGILLPAALAAPRPAGGVDCNGVEVPNDCESVEDQLADCDGNGIADLCDPENDCNRNGVADACDIESGAADENGDGIPDACEAGIRSVHVSFREVESAGGSDRAEVEVLLHHLGFDPGEQGATSWALYIRARNCSILRGTVDGTIAVRIHRGQPRGNEVTFGPEGSSVVPTYTPFTVEVCMPAFHRGDANGDGRIDISNPISTLNALFLEEARCPTAWMPAMPTTMAGFDLSDAVFSLDYLFGPGVQPAPPAPGPPPGPCGPDPCSEGELYLGCLGYEAC